MLQMTCQVTWQRSSLPAATHDASQTEGTIAPGFLLACNVPPTGQHSCNTADHGFRTSTKPQIASVLRTAKNTAKAAMVLESSSWIAETVRVCAGVSFAHFSASPDSSRSHRTAQKHALRSGCQAMFLEVQSSLICMLASNPHVYKAHNLF